VRLRTLFRSLLISLALLPLRHLYSWWPWELVALSDTIIFFFKWEIASKRNWASVLKSQFHSIAELLAIASRQLTVSRAVLHGALPTWFYTSLSFFLLLFSSSKMFSIHVSSVCSLFSEFCDTLSAICIILATSRIKQHLTTPILDTQWVNSALGNWEAAAPLVYPDIAPTPPKQVDIESCSSLAESHGLISCYLCFNFMQEFITDNIPTTNSNKLILSLFACVHCIMACWIQVVESPTKGCMKRKWIPQCEMGGGVANALSSRTFCNACVVTNWACLLDSSSVMFHPWVADYLVHWSDYA